MKLVKNLFLYISAFVPMYVLIFVKLILELINQNLSFNVLNTINFITLLLLILFGSFGLLWNVKYAKEESVEIVISSIQNITDKHFLGYFSLFVFFAIPLDLSLIIAYLIYVLVLIMIGIVYINNSLYYINPLLNILGYSFYTIEYMKDDQTYSAKIFHRGELKIGQKYWVKIKNENFSFIDNKKNF